MSLDIYLTRKPPSIICPSCGHAIVAKGKDDSWHNQNITHNLIAMAKEADLYKFLWRPEENGIDNAKQLIEPLEKAISEMEADPHRFEKYDSPNGWGLYVNFLPWLKRLLEACKEEPDSGVYSSR